MQAISLETSPSTAATNMAALLDRRYEIVIARPGEARYEEAVTFSAEEYQRHFDCHLQSCYPGYFCLLRGGRLLADRMSTARRSGW